MGKLKSRVAGYLSSLQEGGYQISGPMGGFVNYLLDSYFAKSDERALAAAQNYENVPADLDAHIRETWLGCELHHTFAISSGHPPYLRAQTAWAFTRLLTNFIGEGGLYDVVPFLDEYQYKDYLKNSYAYNPKSAQLEISYGVQVTLPVYATLFVIRVSDSKRLVINIDFCYDRQGCLISIQTNGADQDVAEQFLTDFARSLQINDIYRNQCLTFNRGVLGFDKIRDTTWDDVVIKPELKDRIRKNSVGLIGNIEALNKIGFPAKRNCLLISPPGMAKTTMFRAISNEIQTATRIWCTGKSIEYPEHVTALFEAARGLASCIIFIEDMDLFGAERTSHGGRNYILNEFLAQLDGPYSNSGVVVLASTNDFESMDEALLARPGRFNDKIMIPLPDDEERGLMMAKFLKSYNAHRGPSITPDTWKNIVELTEGFTGDYIREVVDTAVLYAVDCGRAMGNSVVIEADDLVKAGTRTMENYQIGNRAKKHIVEISSHAAQKEKAGPGKLLTREMLNL
jgi:ATP-dependent 26S proteasome regulatory subunit